MSDVLLAVIAAAVVLMAVVQAGALIYAARLGRRVERLTTQIEQDVRPIVSDLRNLTTDAAKAMSLAASQVERFDQLFGNLATRMEQTFNVLQTKVLAPVREGVALMAGLRAALAAFRELGDAGRRHPATVEEEDALFIG